MGWTDTQTAAKYSNEALNMLNKKKEICTKGINIATGTAIGTAIGGSVGSGIGATIGGGIGSSIGDVKGISMENIKNDIASVTSQTFENSKNVLKNISTDFSDITKRNLESITKSNLTPEALKNDVNTSVVSSKNGTDYAKSITRDNITNDLYKNGKLVSQVKDSSGNVIRTNKLSSDGKNISVTLYDNNHKIVKESQIDASNKKILHYYAIL